MEQTNQTLGHRVVSRNSVQNLDLKRGHSSDSEDDSKQRKLDCSTTKSNVPTPLFLTVRHKEEGQTLSKVSPFLIHKAFVGAGGEPNAIRKLRNGTILVEAKNESQARRYLNMKSFYDQVNIVVEAHASLNYSKGIVFSRELLDCTVDELTEELRSACVTEVVRITRSENGVLKPTPGHILTFALPHPPESIKAGYLSLSVRPYYRKPQRCFKCQKFGHSSKSCPNPETCCHCGQTGHNSEGCTGEEKCANCKGNHAASSINCRVYLEEREVLKICTDEKLSFVEARKLHRSRQVSLPQGAASYSQVAASTSKPVQCTSCQALEGMVRALTEQVALLVSQLSAGTVPSKAPSSPQPSPTTKPSVKPSGKPVTAQRTSTSTSTSAPVSSKTPYLKSTQQPAKKGLSVEERRTLSDKLKCNIKQKVDSRSKAGLKSPQSSHSSQISLPDDETEEDHSAAVSGRLNSSGNKRREIKFD